MNPQIYKRYMLVILLIIMAFNYVDRIALGLLAQYIKVDLQLSDTEIGFLSGIAFFLFYSVLGIPIARWADRGNRRTIIASTTALWSIAVALCGAAGTFLQLLTIRVAVAVGEAGCVPPAHSLIADHFTREERPKASSIYHLGTPLSFVIGYFGAGWLNEQFGWRATFMLLGLPGLLLAALAWFTIREPRLEARGTGPAHAPPDTLQDAATGMGQPGFREVFSTLWRIASFRHLLFAYSIGSFFGAGIGQWTAAFFIRSFGLGSGELGTWLAIINGVSGFVGVYLGGMLASRFAAGNERLQLKAMALGFSVFGTVMGSMFLTHNHYLAFALMAVGLLGSGISIGPLFAMMQSLVPGRMRAMSIAIVFLCANLVGMGLGPLLAGALSDAFQGWAGQESLRWALVALCPGYFWCAWHFLRAARTVPRDMEQAQRAGAVPTIRADTDLSVRSSASYSRIG